MSKTKRKASTKTKRREAEVAAEWWARETLGCLCTRRPVRTQFQSIDFFGADVVGKMPDGSHVYAQVTTGQAQAARVRRRKLEAYPWHPSDKVYLLQLDVDDSVRPFRWFFRVHEYAVSVADMDMGERRWNNSDHTVDVPREWFKLWKAKEEDNGS